MKISMLILALLAQTFCAARAGVVNDDVQVDVVVAHGESMISISATNVEWTAYVAAGVMDRLNSDKMTCSFFPANGPWQITIFHTNATGQALRGDGIPNTLLTRVWQPNYGPTNFYALGYMPNPMDNNVWNISPVVASKLNPGIFAKQAKYDVPPIDFHFIIDAVNAPSTTYVGAIHFELQVP